MNYEINKNTLAIIPKEDINCIVVEIANEYSIESKPFEVIEHSCKYFGSSYDGRHEGTKNLINVTHKSPIVIEESSNIIFFPTTSPSREDCIWISLNNIENYFPGNNGNSIILFKSGERIEVNISIGSLTNQILRATRLKFVLSERINKNN